MSDYCMQVSCDVIVVVTVAVIQGLDAVMGSPLRGYMSKLVHVKDQGRYHSNKVLKKHTKKNTNLYCAYNLATPFYQKLNYMANTQLIVPTQLCLCCCFCCFCS